MASSSTATYASTKHAAAAAKTCNITNALRHARHLLTDETARTVACSIVGSRLDYCNAVVYGAPTMTINKLLRATEQPRQSRVQVQWSDGRSTFTQIAALATDQRAYQFQGRCILTRDKKRTCSTWRFGQVAISSSVTVVSCGMPASSHLQQSSLHVGSERINRVVDDVDDKSTPQRPLVGCSFIDTSLTRYRPRSRTTVDKATFRRLVLLYITLLYFIYKLIVFYVGCVWTCK